ncbi:PRC-barrel domain-containing protein [Methylocystis sp. 9N]|uniref:PRC-barrel domain-containing protein n=1 Tax=Methylocystis borbori TaxID=3118750 RepID=A0ABU7XH71_9HYPH
MGMAEPNANLISSDKVEGTSVFDVRGDKIGEIEHLMIDRVSGMVRYAIMTFGGFLGFGESEYPLPWKAFRYDTNLGGYVANVTEEQLRNAPEFNEDSWRDRDWETRLHKNYGSAPYWEDATTMRDPFPRY